MKSFLPGFGLAVTFGLLLASCHSAPPPFPPDPPKQATPPKSEAELRLILKQTCDEVNQFTKAEGFSVLMGSPDSCSFELEHNQYFNQTLAKFDNSKDPRVVNAAILAASGRVVDFRNYAVEDAHISFPEDNTSSKTKWTEAQAINVAAKFADIFIKHWGAKLGKPTARYDKGGKIRTQTENPVEGEGEWTVKWEEVTSSGVPFESLGVSISLSEKYGPYSIFVDLDGHPYDDEHVIPISKEKALSIAQDDLDAMVREWHSRDQFTKTEFFREKPEITLLVASPNAFLTEQPTSLPNSGFLNQSEARLAWKVVFKFVTGSEDGDLRLYLDAKDGRFLFSVTAHYL